METRILIIDDTKSQRELLKAYLRRMGFRNIQEAENGLDALDLLWAAQSANAPVQLVISDCLMPELSGIELLKRVRMVPDWKNLPFLMLTSDGEKNRIVEAMEAQVSNYMMKPIADATLKDKLRRVWERHHGKS